MLDGADITTNKGVDYFLVLRRRVRSGTSLAPLPVASGMSFDLKVYAGIWDDAAVLFSFTTDVLDADASDIQFSLARSVTADIAPGRYRYVITQTSADDIEQAIRMGRFNLEAVAQ